MTCPAKSRTIPDDPVFPIQVILHSHHYENHDELRTHLQLFLNAYNHARRLKALRGLTPCEFTCRAWTQEPKRFSLNPSHHTPRLNIERRRWVVERTHAWMARLRRLTIRHEQHKHIHMASTVLGCSLVCLNQIARFQ